MRSDRERLLDIAEATAKIEKYASRGRDVFESDELIQNWILRPYSNHRRSGARRVRGTEGSASGGGMGANRGYAERPRSRLFRHPYGAGMGYRNQRSSESKDKDRTYLETDG